MELDFKLEKFVKKGGWNYEPLLKLLMVANLRYQLS